MSTLKLDEVLNCYVLPFTCKCLIVEKFCPDRIYNTSIDWHIMHLIRNFVCLRMPLRQPEKLCCSLEFSSKTQTRRFSFSTDFPPAPILLCQNKEEINWLLL